VTHDLRRLGEAAASARDIAAQAKQLQVLAAGFLSKASAASRLPTIPYGPLPQRPRSRDGASVRPRLHKGG